MQDPVFIDECKKKDILCLQETKFNDCLSNFVSEEFDNLGFCVHVKNRKKMSKRSSCGILIGFKKSLKGKVHIKETKSKALQCIILSNIGHTKKIVIGSVYVPPSNHPIPL